MSFIGGVFENPQGEVLLDKVPLILIVKLMTAALYQFR